MAHKRFFDYINQKLDVIESVYRMIDSNLVLRVLVKNYSKFHLPIYCLALRYSPVNGAFL